MGKNKTPYMKLLLVCFVLGFLMSLNVAVGEDDSGDVLVEELNESYTSNSVYLWELNSTISMEGMGLSGKVSGNGSASALLVYDDKNYSINSFSLDDETIDFNRSCDDTCSLPGFESEDYLLRYKVDEGVEYRVDEIVYSDSSIGTDNKTTSISTQNFESSSTGITDCKNITSSGNYTLNSDITVSGEAICIDVRADDVTLDCQGNKIEGDGSSFGIESDYDNTIIKNCVVNDWETGIWISDSSNNQLINNTASSNNDEGIFLASSSNNQITSNTANSNGKTGIEIRYSSGDNITDNTVRSNTQSSLPEGGIYLYQCSNTRVINNTASSNYDGIDVGYGSNIQVFRNNASSNNHHGIKIFYPESNNQIINNTANSNIDGINLEVSSNQEIINNFVENNNHSGIHIWNGSNNKIKNNTANSNNWYGIMLKSNSNNTLKGNTANSNNLSGILFGLAEDDSGEPIVKNSWNQIINNSVNSNEDRGILIHRGTNYQLINNTASLNNITGIFLINSSNNTLTGNTANSNEEGINLTTNSHNNTLDSNEFCYSENYDIYDADSNSGDNNTCDTTLNYSDTGETGCTYVCTAAPTNNYFTFQINITSAPQNFSFQIDDASNMEVYWGDGNNENLADGSDLRTHEYSNNGTYNISLNGEASRVSYYGGGSGTPDLLIDILTNISNGVSGINSSYKMFRNTEATNFSAEHFFDDVSRSVTDMSYMFAFSQFNQDISSWEVSNVTVMSSMFQSSQFNQSINDWDVSNVTDMSLMFRDSQFDQRLDSWDVSSVTSMYSMFSNSSFNQDISDWNVSGITDMGEMFISSPFNQNISDWDVSNVKTMGWMFADSQFNQPLNSWDVSNVTYMGVMFYGSQFNQPLNNWNVSGVTDMHSMFADSNFNQNITSWDVSNVTDMSYMFYNASSANPDVSDWNISSLIHSPDYPDYAESADLMFDNSNLSTENYDNILIGWADQSPNLNNNVSLGAQGIYYCEGESARNDTLIGNHNWTITDAGKNCSEIDDIYFSNVSNVSYNYGDHFDYQFNVTSDNPISNFTVNNSNFAINSTGYLNVTNLSLDLGEYHLNVSVNDSEGNDASIIFNVSVVDTEKPYLLYENKSYASNEDVEIFINATDNYQVDDVWINNSEDFNLNSTNYVVNATPLSTGNHYVNLSANDTSGNEESSRLRITIYTYCENNNCTNISQKLGYSEGMTLEDINKVDIAFITDTSGSMSEEWDGLCSILEGLKNKLSLQGIDLNSKTYGLQHKEGLCSDKALKYTVFEGGVKDSSVTSASGDSEDWGPGTTWGAMGPKAPTSFYHSWRNDSVKLAVPISDEAAYQGNPWEGSHYCSNTAYCSSNNKSSCDEDEYCSSNMKCENKASGGITNSTVCEVLGHYWNGTDCINKTCDLIENESECSSDSSCFWDSSSSECFKEDCDIEDESLCQNNSLCKWDSSTCYERSCSELTSEDSCSQDYNCGWNGTECMKDHKICQQETNETSCENSGSCFWDSKNNSCNYDSCYEFNDNESNCQENTLCKWGSSGCNERSCSELTSEDSCPQNYGCAWNGECMKEYEICKEETEESSCNELSDCFWDSSTSECFIDGCYELDENESFCQENIYCKWDSSTSDCDEKSCVNISSEDSCSQDYSCEWIDGSCFDKSEACGEYSDKTGCSDNFQCYWDNSKDSCHFESCRDLTQSQCQDNTVCSWDDSSCYKKQSCSSIDSENICLKGMDSCSWNGTDCFDSSTCELHNTSSSCELQEDCLWNETNEKCTYENCNVMTNETNCESNLACNWEGDECGYKDCDTFESSSSCDSGMNCHWNGTSCYNTQCFGLSESKCSNNPICAYNNNSCDFLNCSNLESSDNCDANNRCGWSNDYNVCYNDCDSIFSEGNCGGSYCDLNFEGCGKSDYCYTNSDSESCNSYNNCSWESSEGTDTASVKEATYQSNMNNVDVFPLYGDMGSVATTNNEKIVGHMNWLGHETGGNAYYFRNANKLAVDLESSIESRVGLLKVSSTLYPVGTDTMFTANVTSLLNNESVPSPDSCIPEANVTLTVNGEDYEMEYDYFDSLYKKKVDLSSEKDFNFFIRATTQCTNGTKCGDEALHGVDTNIVRGVTNLSLDEGGLIEKARTNSQYLFSVDGKEHSLRVLEVGENYTKVRIRSDPTTYSLEVGELKTIDLNNDSIDETSIYLENISYEGAEMTINSDSENSTLNITYTTNTSVNSANVSWSTSQAANYTFKFGKSHPLDNTFYSSNYDLSRKLSIDNLDSGTSYNFEITACDSFENCNTTSGDFTTAESTDTPSDTSGGGGGGGGSGYCGDGTCGDTEDCESCSDDCGKCDCDPSWSCESWSECEDGTKTRECFDANNCGTTRNKPPVTKSCSYCGDGTCDADEDCSTCQEDCGDCIEVQDTQEGTGDEGAEDETQDKAENETEKGESQDDNNTLMYVLIGSIVLVVVIISGVGWKLKASKRPNTSSSYSKAGKNEDSNVKNVDSHIRSVLGLKSSEDIERDLIRKGWDKNSIDKEIRKVENDYGKNIYTKELENWIRNSMKYIDEEEIKNTLLKRGWDEETIEKELNNVKNKTNSDKKF